MKKLLWIDDFRNPVKYVIGDYDIVWVKNYDDFCKYINENGVEKFVNTLVTIDADGLKLSKSDEDIVSLLNNKGLYVSDGKLREDLTNLLMKVDRAGAIFKLLEISKPFLSN